MSATIVTGDNPLIPVSLKKNGASFVIDPGATVRALLRRRGAALTSPVTCSNVAAGANWATSLVVVQFSSMETAALTAGSVELEIEVNDGGLVLTWIVSDIEVATGLIV